MLGLLILFGIALAILIALLTAMLAWQMTHPPRHTLAWAMAKKLPADPRDLSLPFEEWWLDRPDGVRLAVWEIAVKPKSETQSPGSATLTAVFVHGWGHSRIDSLQRVSPFLPLVDRMVLYDLRGHGESTGTSRLGEGEDDDLLTLLDRLGAGPFVLIGHSMGAVIALSAATKFESDRIAGTIAYAPYCEFHHSLEGRLRVNGLPGRPLSDLALLVHRLRGLRPLSLDPERFQALNCPLLIIHGTEDQVSPLEDGRRIASHAPDAHLVEIAEAAHADAHSVEGVRHDAAVQDFTRRVRVRF